LGIHVDNHFTWADHISNVNKKVIKYTGLFYKVSDKIPNDKVFGHSGSFGYGMVLSVEREWRRSHKMEWYTK